MDLVHGVLVMSIHSLTTISFSTSFHQKKGEGGRMPSLSSMMSQYKLIVMHGYPANPLDRSLPMHSGRLLNQWSFLSFELCPSIQLVSTQPYNGWSSLDGNIQSSTKVFTWMAMKGRTWWNIEMRFTCPKCWSLTVELSTLRALSSLALSHTIMKTTGFLIWLNPA